MKKPPEGLTSAELSVWHADQAVRHISIAQRWLVFSMIMLLIAIGLLIVNAL